jgi:hypothetical protein
MQDKHRTQVPSTTPDSTSTSTAPLPPAALAALARLERAFAAGTTVKQVA